MDIQRCFEILELDADADADEAKQAYRDMVNIWHPDRFSANPRLQKKSEERLKEINVAYETLQSVLSARTSTPRASEQPVKPARKSRPETSQEPGSTPKSHKKTATKNTPDKTEAFVEAGTGLVLNLFASFYSAVRRIVRDAAAEINQKDSSRQNHSNVNGTTCRRRGARPGNGMGNRGGGRGQRRGRR